MKLIHATIALPLLALLGCGGEPGELPESAEEVRVAVSSPVATSAFVTAPGTVVSTEKAELATRVSGAIRRIPVDIGARVSRGEALVELDTDDIEARIASARANARLAQQYHQRIAGLARDGAATEQELDEAEARLQMAEAGLRDALAQREYVVLRAPFAGVITARMADPGDLAKPGVPVIEMIGGTQLKVEADLPAELAGRLSVGDAIHVYNPKTGERHPALITRVVPAVETSSRRFRTEARFALDSGMQPNLPPGTFVRVELDEPSATTRWLPGDAVVSRGQLKGVFTVEEDRLRLRWIRTGQSVGESVEVLAGPGTSALVVRNPGPQLVDGQRVTNVERVDWAPQSLQGRTAMRKEEGR